MINNSVYQQTTRRNKCTYSQIQSNNKQQITIDSRWEIFVVQGGLVVTGRYEEYIRVSNQINLDELSINMSTCLPSDIRVAKAIAQLYVDTIAVAEERLQQHKGETK